MKGLMKYVRRFVREDIGPTATEYAVMLSLIVIVCLAAIGALGSKVNTVFNNVETSLPASSSS